MSKYALMYWSNWSETPDEDDGQFESVQIKERDERYYDDKREAEAAAIRMVHTLDRTVYVFKLIGTVSTGVVTRTEP